MSISSENGELAINAFFGSDVRTAEVSLAELCRSDFKFTFGSSPAPSFPAPSHSTDHIKAENPERLAPSSVRRRGPPSVASSTESLELLPVGNNVRKLARGPSSQPYFGLYSNSGFDMIKVLAKVVNRPNPTIDLGPIDLSSSFLVVDARKYDQPIVYVSETFEKLTGYTSYEILGRNCRFLQSPDGVVERGQTRQYVDSTVIYNLKKSIDNRQECQFISMNYRKGGEPFVNLITVVPVMSDDESEIAYFVGFQCDLMAQSRTILRRLEDGSYVIDNNNSRLLTNLLPSPMMSSRDFESVSDSAPASPVSSSVAMNHQDVSPSFADMHLSFDRNCAINSGTCSISPSALESYNLSVPSSPESSSSDHKGDLLGAQSLMDMAQNHVEFDVSPLAPYNVIQSTSDFVIIISSRGIILYITPVAHTIVEYEASEMIGRKISKFTPSGDWISVMRDLKNASVGQSTSTLFRLKRKLSAPIWLEARGHKYEMKNRKRTKCFLLTVREVQVGQVDMQEIARGFVESHYGVNEMWGRISAEGFLLFVSELSSTEGLLDRTPDQLPGTKLADFVVSADISRIQQNLSAATVKHLTCHLQISMKSSSSKSTVIPATLSLYPVTEATVSPLRHVLFRLSALNSIPPFTSHPSMYSYPAENIFEAIREDKDTSVSYELNQLRIANSRFVQEISSLSSDKKPVKPGKKRKNVR